MASGRRHLLTLLLTAATACEAEQRNIEQPTEREAAEKPELLEQCLMLHARTSSNATPLSGDQVYACEQDSGACMASIPCTGDPKDRECDTARLITQDAAVCIADAAGLDPGVNGLEARLVYNYQYRRIIWSVSNTLCSERSLNKCESADESGETLDIDAVSGKVIASLGWLSTS